MDRRDMFEEIEEEEERLGGIRWKEDSMKRTTPSILTVWYNAWKYRNESEAWAGLAVEIIKELEETMPVAQKLRTSWRYNWRNRRNSICFGVILPCFLAVLVAIWFTTIVWLLLDRAQNEHIKGLKYGGLPASVIVAAWGVGKSVMSFVKPISSQVVDYICLPDHSQKLGYHEQVISDINFLKAELYYRPSWVWKVFACIWCCITFSWDENYVPGTMIRKMAPACDDNLRIIVFVDDLDRCQENVILQILSAVNLVLATCEINVILGMDKSMIERAIIRKFGRENSIPNKSSQDLADKYLRKIIQLPLDLPEPSISESQHFLQCQLGMSDSRKGSTVPAAQTEIHNTYGGKNVSPKFQMGTSIPWKTKLARGEEMDSLAESGAKQERAHSFSDTAKQGFVTTERQETVGRPEKGSRVEDTKIEIDKTIDIEQSINSDEQGAGVHKQREDSESDPRHDLLIITHDMLFPEYSDGERNAFCFLHTGFTRTRNPREWKCLLTYHRLAWNMLCNSPQVTPLAGWQVQLIAWVFVCWQWKHLITTLVQNWHDLGVLRKWIMVHDIHKGEVIEENSGPSLREIVEHYIDERWPADKKSDNFQGDSATRKREDTIDSEVGINCSNRIEVVKTSGSLPERTISKDEDSKRDQDYLKDVIRKVLQEEEVEDMLKVIIDKVFKEKKEREKQLRDSSTSCEEEDKGESSLQQGTMVKENQKASHKARNNGKSKGKDEEEEREEWRKLRETLSRYNVSMDGIQAFQKFRFFCEPGHLPWPLPKQA